MSLLDRNLQNTPILSVEPEFTAANFEERLLIVGPPCLSDDAHGESLGLSEGTEGPIVTTHPFDRYKQGTHRHELIALGLSSPSFSDAQHGRSMFERSFAPSVSSERVHTQAAESCTLSQGAIQPERVCRQDTKAASPMSRYLQSAHGHEHLAVELCDSQPFEPALLPQSDKGSPISSISLTVAPSILMNGPLIGSMKRSLEVDDCVDECANDASWESDFELLREQVRREYAFLLFILVPLFLHEVEEYTRD